MLLLRRLSGFDADYFAYYEDIDLCARSWALGYATVFNPAMRVWHRRGASSDRVPRQRAFWAARNQMVTVAKHFPNHAWRKTVLQLAWDHFLGSVLGHAGGIRTQGCEEAEPGPAGRVGTGGWLGRDPHGCIAGQTGGNYRVGPA